MTRRFTETGKWEDKWFRKLPLAAKVLFEFVRDKCDVAGFWEIDLEAAAFFTGLPETENAALGQRPGDSCEGALEVLARAPEVSPTPKVLISDDRKWLYVTNFLAQQGNWPINANTNAGLGIRRAFEARKAFGEEVLQVISEKNRHGVKEELSNGSPTVDEVLVKSPGKGKGKGKSNSSQEEGCRGEGEPPETLVISVQNGAEQVVAVWNTFAKTPVKSAVEQMAVEPAYSRLTLGVPPNRLTHDQIIGAVENYRMACALPDSQAGTFALAKFLLWDTVSKYIPGVFTLEHYSAGNFRKGAPEESHKCAKSHAGGCSGPATHKLPGECGPYWLCDAHNSQSTGPPKRRVKV